MLENRTDDLRKIFANSDLEKFMPDFAEHLTELIGAIRIPPEDLEKKVYCFSDKLAEVSIIITQIIIMMDFREQADFYKIANAKIDEKLKQLGIGAHENEYSELRSLQKEDS